MITSPYDRAQLQPAGIYNQSVTVSDYSLTVNLAFSVYTLTPKT